MLTVYNVIILWSDPIIAHATFCNILSTLCTLGTEANRPKYNFSCIKLSRMDRKVDFFCCF